MNPNFLPDLPPNSLVVLVDSSAITRSCYAGYKDTLTSIYKGRAMDVNALHGYMYRVMKIYEQFNFETMVHVIDPPGGSFYRYGIYPEYKGQRKSPEPALVAQEAILEEVLSAFGERHIRKRGVESDDVIGTMAEALYKQGHHVMIITSDKDLMQLVIDHDENRPEEGSICVARYVNDPYNPRKKIYASYTEDEVYDVWKVRPDQVVDYLALVGDTSDNIPGVKGIGDVKAIDLLNTYGNLESIANNIENIPAKSGREALRKELGNLELYQNLTRIMRNVPGINLPEVEETPDHQIHFVRQLLCWPEHYPSKFTIGQEVQYMQPTSLISLTMREENTQQEYHSYSSQTQVKKDPVKQVTEVRHSYQETHAVKEQRHVPVQEPQPPSPQKTVPEPAPVSLPAPSQEVKKETKRPTFSLSRIR